MWFSNRHPLEDVVHRRPPTLFEEFMSQPVVFLTRTLYSWRKTTPFTPSEPITVVCVSDTHNTYPQLPDGDILVHAGDLTDNGTLEELNATLAWLNSQPHQHKFAIAGNHDELLDERIDPAEAAKREERQRRRNAIMWGNVVYLQDSTAQVKVRERELTVYGSPLTPKQGNGAFQYKRSDDPWKGRVPPGTDILVTHGPPKTHLDANGIGCLSLLEETWRTRPKLHIFGHVHADGGKIEGVRWDRLQQETEQTILDRGGVTNLWRVFNAWILAWLAPKTVKGLLVNAAIVWGLKNEKRRNPVVVEI